MGITEKLPEEQAAIEAIYYRDSHRPPHYPLRKVEANPDNPTDFDLVDYRRQLFIGKIVIETD